MTRFGLQLIINMGVSKIENMISFMVRCLFKVRLWIQITSKLFFMWNPHKSDQFFEKDRYIYFSCNANYQSSWGSNKNKLAISRSLISTLFPWDLRKDISRTLKETSKSYCVSFLQCATNRGWNLKLLNVYAEVSFSEQLT